MKIGIDLGTTNSALAYIDEREAEDRDSPPIHIFETPQAVAAGRVEPRRAWCATGCAMRCVPGFPAPLKALTVVPFGMEEGSEARIPGRKFGLIIGEPAEFPFLASAVRKNDQPGDLIEDPGGELEELAPWTWPSRPARLPRRSRRFPSKPLSPKRACCSSGASPATAWPRRRKVLG